MFLLSTTIIVLSGCKEEKILNNFINDLELPERTEINLPLLSEYQYNGKIIKVNWLSTDDTVISIEGNVYRDTVDKTIILTANATLDKNTVKKTFVVTVVADTDPITLNNVINSIILPTTISKSISLPKKKVYNKKTINIEWSSSNIDIIDNEGNLTKPKVDSVVVLTAKFTLNNHELTKSYSINVVHDEKYDPVNYYHLADVYTGKIEGENTYVEPVNEFPGSVFRKVQSSYDYWLGIEATITLPEFIGDEGRVGPHPNDSSSMRYLDNPSVYLGGKSQKESDIGLSMDVGAYPDLSGKDYSHSQAFIPFWRYINSDGINTWESISWKEVQFYYYPGDKVKISCIYSEDNYMQLRIELLELTTIDKYVQRRNSYNLGDNFERVFISKKFNAPGVGVNLTSFKRVCALDQAANEGKPTQPTNAVSQNIIYHEVYLYREINGEIFKIPFTAERSSSLSAPVGVNSLGDFTNAIKLSYENVNTSLGGEIVTISPNNRK